MSHSHSHSHAHETQGLLSPYIAKRRYQVVASKIKSTDIVLDMGCGVGGFKKYLPEKTKYYGIDSEKNWEGKSKNLFQISIGGKMPKEIMEAKINTVTALAILEHLSDPGLLFREASKVIKKGNWLILTTPHPVGRKLHDTGSKIGIFSNHASDEHEDFLDEKDLSRVAKKYGYILKEYNRFLFGFNQVAIFVKK